jgi:hypothetical protein
MYITWTPRMERHPQPAPEVQLAPKQPANSLPPLEILKEIMLRALTPFPDARAALCRALIEFDKLGSPWE